MQYKVGSGVATHFLWLSYLNILKGGINYQITKKILAMSLTLVDAMGLKKAESIFELSGTQVKTYGGSGGGVMDMKPIYPQLLSRDVNISSFYVSFKSKY